MDITLYTTSNEPIELNKDLENMKQGTFEWKKDTPTDNPRLLMSKTLYDMEYNYAYIPAYGRYYFLSAPVAVAGGMVEVEAKTDVLMTFNSSIKELVCTIERNENRKNGYIVDNKFVAYAYEEIVTKAFPNEMNNDCVILMTMG